MSAPWADKVERLLAEGKAWRAKEVLRGAIGTSGYDRALYRRYAELLLDLGEEMEAGKYFWLAGAAGERAGIAVDVYLTRQRRLTGWQLYFDLPSSARLHSWGAYPEEVARELRARGLAELPKRRERPEPGDRELPQWVLIGCVLLFVLGLLCAIVGLLEIARWVAGLV